MDSVDEVVNSIGYAKVLVSLKRNATAAATTRGLTTDLSEYFSRETAAQTPSTGRVYRSGSRKTRDTPTPAPAVKVYPRLGLALGTVARPEVDRLRADGRVGKIEIAPELSLIRPVAATAATKPTETTWGIRRLNVPAAWDAGFDGSGIVVGHLDTGFDAKHPALKAALHAFAEFDLRGELLLGAPPRDSDEHGTHTAGTIAGRKTGRGHIGVAPGCMIASAMVIEYGDVISRILGGLEWIVEQGATVLSMSLGLRGYTPAFQTVINALINNDVLPVIAVGNEYAGTSRSPGNYANVLSVGAMSESDLVADFSCSQRFNRDQDPLVPDLVAPGVGVLSCVPGGKYALLDGSSMATPHVAGIAAILRQAAPSVSVAEIEVAIQQACVRPKKMAEERANRGVPDVMRALAELEIDTVKGAALTKKSMVRSKSVKTLSDQSTNSKKAAASEAKVQGKPQSWKVSIGKDRGKE